MYHMCFVSNICWKLGKFVLFSLIEVIGEVCKLKMIEVQCFKRERDALLNWLEKKKVKFIYSEKTIRIELSKLQ